MLNKYTFSNNLAVVDLPSIWKIGNGKVSITHASGTNTVNIPSSGYLTVKVGNIFSIQEEDISPIEAIEIENPNPGNNSGNDSGGSSSSEGSSSEGGSSSEEGGSSSGGGSSEGDNNQSGGSSNTEISEGNNINIGLILNNTSNEDIYLSGYFEIGVEISGDWAPMCIRIFPQNTGITSYKLNAGQSVTIEHTNLQFWVRNNENSTTETASKYLGGATFNTFSNGVDGYHRAYSWSINKQGNTAEDSSYVIALLEITPFVSNGYVIVNISGTNPNEADDFDYKNIAIELQ